MPQNKQYDFTRSAISGRDQLGRTLFNNSNFIASPRNSKSVLRMKNSSGGALAAGDVVVYAAAANGDEVTTTTSGGSNKVLGMAMEAIASGTYGRILVGGFTDALKVNGTTDIAVGDWLSTYTTAKIAQKASAGHMVFAMALEAYTANDSNGVIDALLVSPRLI